MIDLGNKLMRKFVLFIVICPGLHVSCAHKSGHRINTFASSEIQVYESGQVNQSEDISEDFSYAIKLDQSNQQVLKRTAYSLSYNPEILLPNWVAWRLTAEHTEGKIPRDNAYYEDESVPFPRATNEDYRGSGWSHGHMCPAADNKWDAEAMRESNLLTNICPQHASLNTGLWNTIERDCRKWAKRYGEVYIVCGPVLLNREHETIGENNVVVPEAFFKVVLRLNPKPAAIGFIVRNNEGKKKKDQFINTVDDVERITGIDFFPFLEDSIEDMVEASSNIEDWQ